MKATDWKLGMSSCATHDLSAVTFEQYAAHGVEMMEISPSAEQYESLDWNEIRKNADKTGVKLWSFHLPFFPFEKYNIASLSLPDRREALKIHSEYIKRASEIGVGIAVIHPSGEPNAEKDREEMLKVGADSLAQLAETAHKSGITVAAEDLPRTCLGNCSSDIKRLISQNDKLRVCFDTNHLLTERNVDFVRTLGEKIITIHVSDYDFLNERHWLPYEGKNNWIELVTALEDVGYSGPFMYEIGFATPSTINRRNLTFADFTANYKACVEKQRFDAFGIPDTEECMRLAYFKKPQIN